MQKGIRGWYIHEELRDAVIEYEKAFNLSADGVVGVDTNEEIQLVIDQLLNNRET